MPDFPTKPNQPVISRIREVLEEGRIAALATIVEGETLGRKLLVEETGVCSGSLGVDELDAAVSKRALQFLNSRDDAHVHAVKEFAPQLENFADTRILFERLQPEPRIVICGAGHVGAALARLATAIGYKALLIDDRGEFLQRQLFPDERIDLIHAPAWGEAVKEAVGNGRGVSVAVVTRGHNEDEECLRAVFNTRPDYVGLIGSRRRTRIVLERLRAAGIGEDLTNSVRAPIGLDIGAVTPEEVALAILAEIVAERRGGKGGRLSER